MICQNRILLLISGNNYLNTLLQICLRGILSAIPYRPESCFVCNIGKFCTGCTGCHSGNLREIYIICQFDLLRMHLQDLFTSLQVRQFYRNTTVKTSRSEQCRIQRFRPVGCRQNHHTIIAFKSIHFCQQLIQCLLSFIIAAHLSVTLFSYGINLINKNDTRCLFLRLTEQITYFRCSHPYKHLNKF